MSKKEAETQERIERLVESRFRLQIEMLEKINAALVEDNNRLGAELQAAQRERDVTLGR